MAVLRLMPEVDVRVGVKAEVDVPLSEASLYSRSRDVQPTERLPQTSLASGRHAPSVQGQPTNAFECELDLKLLRLSLGNSEIGGSETPFGLLSLGVLVLWVDDLVLRDVLRVVHT